MDLSYASYYHGPLCRSEAEQILQGKLVGSYLLRKNVTMADKYALSVTASDKIIHYAIEKSSQTELYSVSHGSGHENPVLVCEHYFQNSGGLKTKLLYPVPCEKQLSSVASQTDRVSISSNSNYEEHDWFHGKITRQEDTRRLSNTYYLTKKNGIFLVRLKDEGKFVLSLVHSEKVHRYIITRDPKSNEYFLDEKQKNLRFDSIEDLLEFHQKYPPEVTGLQCQLSIPCCRSSVAINEKEVSRSTSNSATDGFMSSVKSLASALATELKAMLPVNSLDINWSDTSGQSKENEEKVFSVPPKNSSFNRFNRKSLPKESIGFYSPYRSENGKSRKTCVVAPDLFISADKIKLMGDLGKGHFGSVKQAECFLMGENVPCAVKVLSGSDVQKNKDNLLKEAALMQSLDHPFIVRLLAVCQPKTQDANLMIVLELAPLGTLKNFIRGHNPHTFSEHRILVLMNQVCEGMAYLAQNNVVHRDLAARNILMVSEYFVKISDFGMSRILHDTENFYKASKPGTWPLRWYPPEALLHYKFTSKGDVWSFGVTVWEVCSYGSRPYKSMKGKEILQMIENENRLNCPDGCSPGVYSLLLQCWMYEPTKRPSFQKILEIFEDLLKQ